VPIPIDMTFFDNPQRTNGNRLLYNWPDDPVFDPEVAATIEDLDTRHGLTFHDIEAIIGGGSPIIEINWLKSLGLIQPYLKRVVVQVSEARVRGVANSVIALRHDPMGAYYALTKTGREVQARMRKDSRYASCRIETPDSNGDSSLHDADGGDDSQGNRVSQEGHEGGGGVSDSQRPAQAQGADRRVVGRGDGDGGPGGVGLPDYLTEESASTGKNPSSTLAGGIRTQATGSTATSPASSQVTSRKPRTLERDSGIKA
jgi:hypothetical protein